MAGGRWRGTLRRGCPGADLVRAGGTGWKAEGTGKVTGHGGVVAGEGPGQVQEGECVGACVRVLEGVG